MAYPIDDLTNVHLNASTDDPSQARPELNALLLKVQAMIAATGIGANNALKLDSNGDVPTGVSLADALPITGGGTGAATAPAALVNLGLTATAAQLNYNNISTLGAVQASKTVTSNSSNGVNFGHVSVLPSVTGGSTTVYTVTTGITAYETNRVYEVRINATNTGGATINFDSLGAKTIKTLAGDAIVTGQLLINNIAKLHYDGTDMLLLNPESSIESAIVLQARASSAQTISSAVTLQFNVATIDTHSYYDTGNYKYLPLTAGYYRIDAQVTLDNLVSGDNIYTFITVDSITKAQVFVVANTTSQTMFTTWIQYFNGTNTDVWIRAWNTTRATSTLSNLGSETQFNVTRIGS